MAKADSKTNVMRILEQRGITYRPHEYPHADGAVSALAVAELLGVPAEMLYKTLVARGASRGHYVFVIPAGTELDLKKAARAAGEKSVEMLRQAELAPTTGYVHGGCSPVGMKKPFPTLFQEDVVLLDTVIVSAGKIGRQIELAPADLLMVTDGGTADLVFDPM